MLEERGGPGGGEGELLQGVDESARLRRQDLCILCHVFQKHNPIINQLSVSDQSSPRGT